MNREEMIVKLKEFSDRFLQNGGKVFVFANLALVYHNITQDTKDIDMFIFDDCVAAELIKSKEYYVSDAPMGGTRIQSNDNVYDCFPTDIPYSFYGIGFNKTDINGVYMATPYSMINFYEIRGREKDLKKIELINNYMR